MRGSTPTAAPKLEYRRVLGGEVEVWRGCHFKARPPYYAFDGPESHARVCWHEGAHPLLPGDGLLDEEMPTAASTQVLEAVAERYADRPEVERQQASRRARDAMRGDLLSDELSLLPVEPRAHWKRWNDLRTHTPKKNAEQKGSTVQLRRDTPLMIIRAFVASGAALVRLDDAIVGLYPSPEHCRNSYQQSAGVKHPELGVSVHIGGGGVWLAAPDVDVPQESGWEWAAAFWREVDIDVAPQMERPSAIRTVKRFVEAFLDSPFDAVALYADAPGAEGDTTLASTISKTPHLRGRVAVIRRNGQPHLVRKDKTAKEAKHDTPR